MFCQTDLRYLASVFVDAASIRPSPQEIADTMRILSREDLLPFSLQQMGPEGVIPRMGFQSMSGEWRVVLLGERFDVSHHPTSVSAGNMVGFADFCATAAAKLSALLEHFRRRAHRLAAVQEGFLPEMSEDGQKAVLGKLMLLPPVFRQHAPFEWDWRVASIVPRLIAGEEEKCNTILTVKRSAGRFHPPEGDEVAFDRIRADIDVNTAPDNTGARFGEREISDFFAKVPTWHLEVGEELMELIGLGAADGNGS